MRNRPEYLEAMFAIWHAGLVAVPVNARLHRDEIAYILEHSESAVVVTDADHADDVEPLVGTVASLQAAVVAPGERWDRLTASSPAPLVDRQPEDPAWLFYTSGTTGRPKGATLTNRNLLMASLSYFADIDPVMPQDCILHAAPLSHGSGLYGLPHVARGAVSVVPQSGGVDGDEIAALLRRWPGMSFFAAPTMVKRLAGDRAVAAADLSHLKTIIYGGAPMYLADLEDALAVFGPRLAQIYGQGETPMTITALSKADHADRDHPRWRDRLQSVGVPRTDVEVRVVDDDDRDLPAGEIGEVVVRGDVVMAGYWNQPDATAEALRGGWLHTGDVGSFDADGYLTLRDRSKDLIISGGMNIYPREVEEALLRHPGVRAAAVVGRPDPEWGEAVVAFVVAADGAAPPPVEELDRTCLDRIARFKRPKDYRFVDALPTNNYGKVVKRELRDRLRAEAERRAADGSTSARRDGWTACPRLVTFRRAGGRGLGGAARPRASAVDTADAREEAVSHEARSLPAELPRQGDRQGARGSHQPRRGARLRLRLDARPDRRPGGLRPRGAPVLVRDDGASSRRQLPVSSRGEWFQGWPLIPWLAAKTTKVRIGMSITDTPYRAPGVLAAEIATVDHLSNGRVNVGVGSGWMPEEFAAASASHIFPKRHKHVRETIEIMQGIWTNDLFEYHGEFADFDRCGFGAKPVQKPHPPIFFSGLKDPKRSANRIAKYDLAGWIGIQDTPDELQQWRGAIQRELEELGSSRSVDDLEICSMIWFVITDEETDQTPQGKATNLLAGTAAQITDNLKRYKEAGLTMPLLWPPFTDVPVSKTLDDLKRLKEEIMPKVEAA